MRSAKYAIAACTGVLALPAAASAAQTGGFGYDGAGMPAIDGSQLTAGVRQIVGRPVTFSGRLSGVRAGEPIDIQRAGAAGQWTLVARVIAAADGSFTARWTPSRVERFAVRAVPQGPTLRSSATTPTSTVAIFKSTKATWYGPGLYGSRTYCGKRLTRRLVGVAHKRLPCGTKVEVLYNGRSIVVPVVDRGPFGTRAEYDLTAAAARRLGVSHTVTVGALPAASG